MKLNVGSADRMIRLIAGVALFVLLFTGTIGISSTFGIITAIVAAILVGTGSISFCPAYSLLGLRTRPQDAG
ncbi:MAG: DUF2892 domain-containing protein [Pseudomonadota bacterium]